jgi:hypothetical protein
MLASSILYIRCLIVAAVLLLLFIDDNCKAGLNMEDRSTKINLAPFAMKDAPSVGAIELIESRQGVQLLSSTTKGAAAAAGLPGSQTVISATPFSGGGMTATPLFVIDHLLPPPPEWDVCANPDESYSLVYEMALGASYTVLLRHSKNADVPVTDTHPFESFTSPRFIKRYQNDLSHPVTAISEKKAVVLFTPDVYGHYRRYMRLSDGISALLVKTNEEFVLFYKVIEPGAVRGNLIYPGRLYSVRLTKDFVPATKAVELFPNKVIFEFDVDVSGSHLAIFATSPNDLLLAWGSAGSAPLKFASFGGQYRVENLTRPAVLLSNSQVHLAILESARTTQARLLTASSAMQAFR